MAASTVSSVSRTATVAGSSLAGIYTHRVDANNRRDVDTKRIANKTTVRAGDTIYEFAAYAMDYSLWHPIGTVVEQDATTWGGHFKATRLLGQHQISVAFLPSAGSTKGTSKDTNNQVKLQPAIEQHQSLCRREIQVIGTHDLDRRLAIRPCSSQGHRCGHQHFCCHCEQL
jgi:hypothetical protein